LSNSKLLSDFFLFVCNNSKESLLQGLEDISMKNVLKIVLFCLKKIIMFCKTPHKKRKVDMAD